MRSGWLEDKFGLSRQIVPTSLPDMRQDEDPKRAERVMAALLRIRRLDIAGLKRAYASR